jgi:hypothetical protein
MRRVRRAVIFLACAVLVAAGTCIALWPRVSWWRIRYWAEPSARCIALTGLMNVTDDGGWLELRHAARSEDERLRVHAAEYLAARGDREGVRVIVDLCYEYPDGALKFTPRSILRETVEGDLRLAAHGTSEKWWRAHGDELRHLGGGRWRLER